MDDRLLLEPRLVGALIVVGLALPLVGAGVVAGRGDLRGLTAGFRGVEGVGEAAAALATVTRFAVPGFILQVVGFGLLTVLLVRAGDPVIASVAFALLLFSLVLAAVEGSFHGSVTAWAGKELAPVWCPNSSSHYGAG